MKKTGICPKCGGTDVRYGCRAARCAFGKRTVSAVMKWPLGILDAVCRWTGIVCCCLRVLRGMAAGRAIWTKVKEYWAETAQ